MTMNKLTCGLWAGLALSLLQAGAAETGWLTDLSKAQSTAKAENKTILLDFTGSNW